MGALTDEERATLVQESILNSKYETMIDDVSAYEVITGRAAKTPVQAGGGYTYSADFNTPVETPQPEQAVEVEVTQEREPEPEKTVASAKEVEEQGSAIGNMAENLLGRSGTRQVVRSTGGSIGREVGKVIGEAVLGKKGKTIGGNIGASLGRNLFGTLFRK